MTLLNIKYLDLHRDQDTLEAIDKTIREGVQIVGTNLWVLIFAILIASVGLNVNSTAAIIGAMLISPLMGPIIGIGYGAGINDFRLIRLAARNLGIFVLISLVASTFYFLLTPLFEAHSELLARTSPNIWDVLIAFFGGGAGIVALTRKNRSTVIPGVAIATALMPPLCTAGYGLATGHFRYFFGAFYLFVIDGVFIAFATLVFVKVMKLPQYSFPGEADHRNSRIWIAIAVTVTMLPSAYLAYRMVRDEFFVTAATNFVADLERDPNVIILGKGFDPKLRQINLIVSGRNLPSAQSLKRRLADFGLQDATVKLRSLQSEDTQKEFSLLKQQLQQDLTVNLLKSLESKNQRIYALEQQIQASRANETEQGMIFKEIRALYPGVDSFTLGRGVRQDASSPGAKPALIAVIGSQIPLSGDDQARLKAWLSVRFPQSELHVDFEAREPASVPKSRPKSRRKPG